MFSEQSSDTGEGNKPGRTTGKKIMQCTAKACTTVHLNYRKKKEKRKFFKEEKSYEKKNHHSISYRATAIRSLSGVTVFAADAAQMKTWRWQMYSDVDGNKLNTFWHSMGGVNGEAIDTLVKFNDENKYELR